MKFSSFLAAPNNPKRPFPPSPFKVPSLSYITDNESIHHTLGRARDPYLPLQGQQPLSLLQPAVVSSCRPDPEDRAAVMLAEYDHGCWLLIHAVTTIVWANQGSSGLIRRLGRWACMGWACSFSEPWTTSMGRRRVVFEIAHDWA